MLSNWVDLEFEKKVLYTNNSQNQYHVICDHAKRNKWNEYNALIEIQFKGNLIEFIGDMLCFGTNFTYGVIERKEICCCFFFIYSQSKIRLCSFIKNNEDSIDMMCVIA